MVDVTENEVDDPPETLADAPATEPSMFELANGWRIGTPVNLGPPVNSASSDQHPTLTSDGLTLVFGSYPMGDHFGLWISTRTSSDQPWNDPVKLDKPSGGSAHLSADGLSLVFSSREDGGFGRNDLWMATRPSRDDPFGPPGEFGCGCQYQRG